jgi:hypothetical protein
MAIIHFEELWEKCEKFHNNNSKDYHPGEILNELELKITLLKTIEENDKLSNDDKIKAREHMIGEILFSIANLSSKYNIDVYKTLYNTIIDKLN